MRHGGRQKGTPNKATQDLFAVCEKHGVDVFEAMVMIAKDETDKTKKFHMFSEIAQYLYPKRKQVEVESGENGFEIIVKKYINEK